MPNILAEYSIVVKDKKILDTKIIVRAYNTNFSLQRSMCIISARLMEMLYQNCDFFTTKVVLECDKDFASILVFGYYLDGSSKEIVKLDFDVRIRDLVLNTATIY